MPVAYTTTYWKIKGLEKPIKLVQGSQGAGKNVGTAILLTEREDARIITILTDSYPNLRDGPIQDFKFILKEWGMSWEDHFNKSESNLQWGDTEIQFRHADNNKPDKGKGPRRDILYINEGNRMGWAAVKHYIARSKEVIVDYNPDFDFWAMEELLPREDCERIIVTYKDNEMCPENEVRYIESRRHKTEWFRVYGLGLTGTYSERRIYDFEVVKEFPEDIIKIPSGMDFGQSPDPTVLIDCYIKGTSLYAKTVFKENNLMPEKITGAQRDAIVDRMDDIALERSKNLLKEPYLLKDREYYLDDDKAKDDNEQDKFIRNAVYNFKNELIIGDSAGARELKDMKKHNYNVRSVKKGPGSVKDGMKQLKSYDIKVLESDTDFISALSNYLFDEDHNGKIVPEPPKMHEPDQISAIRYVVMGRPLWNHLVPQEQRTA